MHSTGAGKLCASTAIMDAFWSSDASIYFVTSPSALQSNPPSTFYDCARMFPRFKSKSPVDIEKSFSDRNVIFTTYAKLAHMTGLYRPNKRSHRPFGVNPVFIIDEAHTLLRPIATQRGEMDAILQYITGNNALKLFLLTATPGDTANEILKLLNVLQPLGTPPLQYPVNEADAVKFMKACRFMVSYYDASMNKDIFPEVFVQEIRVPMSIPQFTRYVDAMKDTTPEDKDYAGLKADNKLHRYFSSARRFSNALFKKDTLSLQDAAAKVASLVNSILANDNSKHYVYSMFAEDRGLQSQGIHVVAHALRLAGYEQMTISDAGLLVKYDANPPIMRKKRFVILTSKELGRNKEAALQNMVTVYNWPHNAEGQYLHVMLASQNYNESMDLKSVQHVHILEPLLSVGALKQTIGRASRRCSHSQLPTSARHVVVHKYVAMPPSKSTEDTNTSIDEHTELTVRQEYNPVAKLLLLMKLSSMDCAYHKQFHGIKYKCLS